ncbi:unnamed protein product, partial [Prunus brigantina]
MGKKGVWVNALTGKALMRGVLPICIFAKFIQVQKCPDLARLATPPYAFPALNVQLVKQPTASGDFLPPRSDALADAREGKNT